MNREQRTDKYKQATDTFQRTSFEAPSEIPSQNLFNKSHKSPDQAPCKPSSKETLQRPPSSSAISHKETSMPKVMSSQTLNVNRDASEICLRQDNEGLTLVKGNMALRADFSSLRSRIEHNKLPRELLVRATKLKGVSSPAVIDATAGFGEDSFLLAATGAQVYMFERDPLIAQLLRDALERASRDEALASIVSRMTLIEKDCIDELKAMTLQSYKEKEGQIPTPDIIYLDPMFPARTKSAAVKKKFQLIHVLEKPCEDEEELLEAALALKPRKVVIKRPIKGPFLAGRKPSYSLRGKAIRYDCFVFAG